MHPKTRSPKPYLTPQQKAEDQGRTVKAFMLRLERQPHPISWIEPAVERTRHHPECLNAIVVEIIEGGFLEQLHNERSKNNWQRIREQRRIRRLIGTVVYRLVIKSGNTETYQILKPYVHFSLWQKLRINRMLKHAAARSHARTAAAA